MQQQRSTTALPPATLEGWYAAHQALHLDWPALRALPPQERAALVEEARGLMRQWSEPQGGGWSAAFHLAGGGGDLMLIHFRETLDAVAQALLEQKRSALAPFLRTEYEFLSVTEAGLYHATAQAAAEHEPHSKEYRTAVEAEAAAELATPHVRIRLYPQVPEGMRYVCFYPMSKRRNLEDNWYALPIAERNRMMREHGLSGRRYAGKIFQVITGSVGFADWEWGVTLFAKDPLEFKRIVTELRYDEASARFGEFGRFFTGIQLDADHWQRLIGDA
jgi:hydrogen peroxide-dependent heme synthase